MTSAALAIPEDPQAVLAAADDPHQFVLVALDRAKAWLTTATSIEDLNELRARARMVEMYVTTKHLARDAAQAATEIRVRTERRLGQLLQEMKTEGRLGGRGGDRRSTARPPVDLSSLGVSEEESRQAQEVAQIPEDRFEEVVAEHLETQTLSRAAVLREGAAAKEESDYRDALEEYGLEPLTDPNEIARLRQRNQDLGHLGTTCDRILDLAKRFTGEQYAAAYGDDATMPHYSSVARAARDWLSDLLDHLEDVA